MKLISTSLRRLGGILVITSAMSMFVIACLAVRLLIGPIDVPLKSGFLERAMAEIAPGWGLSTAHAQIELLSDDGLSGLVLRDVELRDPGGTLAAKAPRLALRFALSPSLDIGNALSIREVALAGAAVDVLRDETGAFRLGVRGAALSSGGEGGGDLAALLREADADALPRLRVADARIGYADAATGTRLTAESGSVELIPRDDGIDLKIEAVFPRQDERRTSVALIAHRVAADGTIGAKLRFDGLIPQDIAGLDPTLAALSGVRVPLDGEARFDIDGAGNVTRLETEVSGRPGGTIAIGADIRTIDRFSAVIGYDVAAGRVGISSLDIAGPAGEIRLNGTAQRSGGSLWRADLDVSAPRLTDRARGLEISADTAQIAGNYDLAAGTLRIESLMARSPRVSDRQSGARLSLGLLETGGRYERDGGAVRISGLRGADVALEGKAGLRLRMASLDGSVTLPPGATELRLDGVRASALVVEGAGFPLSVAELAFNGSYRPETQSLGVTELALGGFDAQLPSDAGAQSPAQRFAFAHARLSGETNLATLSMDAPKITVEGLAVSLPDLYDRALSAETLTATLSARREKAGIRLRISDAAVQIEDLPARLRAEILFAGTGAGISGRLESELGPTGFARVPAFWPKGVAPGALRWIKRNVRAGEIGGVRIDANFDTARPDTDRMTLDFDFDKAAIAVTGDLPLIENARGTGVATLKTFKLDLRSAVVKPPQAPPFRLRPSTFAITDFKPEIPSADIEVNADGPVQSILRYLDQEPLGFISKAGFDISSASAQTEAQVRLRLPLANDLAIEDVRFAADGRLTGFTFLEPHTGIPVAGDSMALKVREDGLEFESDARFDGLAARLRYRQPFSRTEGEPESRLTLQSYLTLEDFARRGVDLEGYFDGVAVIDAKIDLFEGGDARFEADADLTGAALDLDLIGWGKPDGSRTTVLLRGFRNADGHGRVESLAIRGDAIQGDASLVFDPAGTVTRADFTKLVLAKKFDAALRYFRGVDGGARVELEGRMADLRKPFFEAVDARSGQKPLERPGDGPTTEIALRLGMARLRDDLIVDGLRGGLRLRGERTVAAKIEGRMNRAAPFLLLAERRRDGLALRVSADDAGAFLKAASVFSGAHGGRLQLDVRTRDVVLPSEVAGNVRIEGTTIRDSQTLRRILADGAVGSLVRQMTANGLTLDKVNLPFNGVGGRWRIANGVAHGPALGLTLRGNYDIAQKTVDLNGTVSPAYAINGALGSVPLLGALLTGGEGEGVFGVTFAVRGPTDDPNVWVNPLSALAPGFLRKIVAGVMDGEPEGSARPEPVFSQQSGQ